MIDFKLKKTILDCTDLPDAWFQLVYACLDHGRRFTIDRGSYAGQTRLELDWVDFHIAQPYLRDADGRPLVPIIPEGSSLTAPVDPSYTVEQYWKYLMTPVKAFNEDYTYGQRLWAANHTVNQVQKIIDTYLKYGWRNNQMVLQVAEPADIDLADPPCLRSIDTRIQDGALHFFIYFRSWDLWGGLPANLAGISILQEYMAQELGVAQGEMICTSKGLHLYGYAEELAKMRCLK